jgi:hypothetical protein
MTTNEHAAEPLFRTFDDLGQTLQIPSTEIVAAIVASWLPAPVVTGGTGGWHEDVLIEWFDRYPSKLHLLARKAAQINGDPVPVVRERFHSLIFGSVSTRDTRRLLPACERKIMHDFLLDIARASEKAALRFESYSMEQVRIARR